MGERLLNSLHVGDHAIIRHFDHEQSIDGHKLMMLGLTPGTHIEVIRLAPFSDPMVIRFRGYKLSLRKSDLTGIWVTLVNEK